MISLFTRVRHTSSTLRRLRRLQELLALLQDGPRTWPDMMMSLKVPKSSLAEMLRDLREAEILVVERCAGKILYSRREAKVDEFNSLVGMALSRHQSRGSEDVSTTSF